MGKLVGMALLALLGSAGFFPLLARMPQESGTDFLFPAPGKQFRGSGMALAADSFHSYDVRHYRLDFQLPMTHAGYTCHEQLSFISRVPSLDTVELDFDNLVCDSVKRNGAHLRYFTPSGKLVVLLDQPLPQGDSAVLHLFFHRESTAREVGYYFCRPPTRIYAHAMTCGCPRENHYWFACYDHPADKAERGCMINLTVPDSFQTSANGLCDSVTVDTGKQTRTYWWRHPYPICTYLMTFSASRFASWSVPFVNSNGETIPVIHYMWPQDSAATQQGYANLLDMMQYYADTTRFGPYPFERFGFIPGYYGFPWGGMEHQTTVMLHPSYIGGGSDIVQAHELSHMWWGDMVTHVGYADVWLNEGFATWAEVLYMGHKVGRQYFAGLMRGRAGSYFNRDRSYRFPLYNPPWNYIYDYGTIYCKGAWVQHMLRYVVGDTAWEQPGAFFRALRAYRDSFAYGTVSTEDYQRVLEQVTGLELDWFFADWVYQAGYPKYNFFWSCDTTPSGPVRVVTRLAQNNGPLAPAVFRIPVPVRFWNQVRDTLVTIRPRTSLQVDTFLFSFYPESVALDPDNWILDSCYTAGVAEERAVEERKGGAGFSGPCPNPARDEVGFLVWGAGEGAKLLITDVTGRQVRHLPVAKERSGKRVVWDRTDERGRRVPAGVYFCRIELGKGTARQESARLRLVLLD